MKFYVLMFTNYLNGNTNPKMVFKNKKSAECALRKKTTKHGLWELKEYSLVKDEEMR